MKPFTHRDRFANDMYGWLSSNWPNLYRLPYLHRGQAADKPSNTISFLCEMREGNSSPFVTQGPFFQGDQSDRKGPSESRVFRHGFPPPLNPEVERTTCTLRTDTEITKSWDLAHKTRVVVSAIKKTHTKHILRLHYFCSRYCFSSRFQIFLG